MFTRFANLYEQAFDENGEVKVCGREVCQELILLANQIEPDINHGNPYTGMMEVEAMHRLHTSIRAKA